MPAYIIFTKTRTRNAAELDRYVAQAPAFMAGHPGEYLARFGGFVVKEGGGIEGVAILEFPTVQAAVEWYESPTYQAASQHRHLGGDYNVVIVEGVAPMAAP